MTTPDFSSLYKDLSVSLRKAEKNRRIIRLAQVPVYLIFILWMIFVLTSGYWINSFSWATNAAQGGTGIMMWVIPPILLISVGNMILSKAYARFAEQEQNAMSKIIKTLFPEARYSPASQAIPAALLRSSRLFTGIGNDTQGTQAYTFASIEINTNGTKLNVADIGVSTGAKGSGIRAYYQYYRMILRLLFAGRIDRAMYDFRGMFSWVELGKRLPGSVIILPDHLEEKMGYLAKSIQSMRNSRTDKLVQMEDPDFERHFAVYSSDEVLARYILTPAMMRNITRLRQNYGRDIMLSFNATRFCFAVSMPDGFLSLRNKAIDNDRIVQEIYDDVLAASTTLQELKLDRIIKSITKG